MLESSGIVADVLRADLSMTRFYPKLQSEASSHFCAAIVDRLYKGSEKSEVEKVELGEPLTGYLHPSHPADS